MLRVAHVLRSTETHPDVTLLLEGGSESITKYASLAGVLAKKNMTLGEKTP